MILGHGETGDGFLSEILQVGAVKGISNQVNIKNFKIKHQ
jgi:hypothetical protein